MKGQLNITEASATQRNGIFILVFSRPYSRMKPSIAIICCFLVLGVDSQSWFEFMKEAGQGTRDMWRAYSDMREANWKYSDRYFRARGNYDAAQRGPGGAWAAKVIRDPNYFRPPGLPSKY
ncbi:serum amyloid A-1 protein-like isoform X2 [Peromyscus eremicus]|uniref:serum amyloid A-1 protein-like isoform X2 n=1 Tax=Peromyscus eremicus TaxID=42410 RepID=UPI0027DBB10A|nr:serum amyloid A-1 protein-like isoform X2 [Peromyscus eremicus]